MKTILVIDDKDHALQQILHEFPPAHKATCVFKHFASQQQFRAAKPGPAFLIFLDFFFDHDRSYGTTLLPELACEHLICFSSMQPMSDHMCQVARAADATRIKHAYSVQKLKYQLPNPPLRLILNTIFGP